MQSRCCCFGRTLAPLQHSLAAARLHSSLCHTCLLDIQEHLTADGCRIDSCAAVHDVVYVCGMCLWSVLVACVCLKVPGSRLAACQPLVATQRAGWHHSVTELLPTALYIGTGRGSRTRDSSVQQRRAPVICTAISSGLALMQLVAVMSAVAQ